MGIPKKNVAVGGQWTCYFHDSSSILLTSKNHCWILHRGFSGCWDEKNGGSWVPRLQMMFNQVQCGSISPKKWCLLLLRPRTSQTATCHVGITLAQMTSDGPLEVRKNLRDMEAMTMTITNHRVSYPKCWSNMANWGIPKFPRRFQMLRKNHR
jgi:hypothetical protein